MALKVLDVDGERLPDAEGRTQNFVLVNGPVFQNKTSDQFLGNLKMLAGTTDKLESTKEVMSTALRVVNTALEAVGISSPKVQALGGSTNPAAQWTERRRAGAGPGMAGQAEECRSVRYRTNQNRGASLA